MLKLPVLIIALFITSRSIYSQVDIQISVKQSHSKQAKLFLYQQSGAVLVDSSSMLPKGLFRFKLPIDYKQGLYRFVIGKNISVDLVAAAEPQIIIETVVFAAEDSAKSIVSKENETYFQYQKIKKRLKQKIWLLNSLVDFYSDSSAFHNQLIPELDKAQIELYNESKSLALNNPNLFTSNLILFELKPIPRIRWSSYEQNAFMKQNWWSDVNLWDNRFINLSALGSRLWGFMELFIDDSFDKEQQDLSFIAAVKNVMNLNAEPLIKNYFRKILLDNYLYSDYDAVAKFLIETSFSGLSALALNPEEKSSYDLLLSNAIGTKAKDFSLKVYDGTKQKLSKASAPYKLIAFWSMRCPHCTEMLPELYRTYLIFRSKGFEVVTICIDDELDEWRKFVNDKKQIWINTIEPDNGESKIIKEYNVDGTPKLFLVDKDMIIISKPTNVKQLEAKLKEVFR